MPERIRFHLDENMDPDIATALRRFGVDVSTTADRNLRGTTDAAQLDFARAERRVIVTDDTDFLRIANSTTDHPGIVFCRRTRHSVGEIIRYLLLIHEVLTPDEIAGMVEYV